MAAMFFRRHRKTKTMLCACFAFGIIVWLHAENPVQSNSLRIRGGLVAHCKERTNFVYLKMIKCASETLNSVFHRFGYTRNLSFVLPVSTRLYVGWPYNLEPSFYRPSKTGEFNILCEHFVFNQTYLADIMPSDTVYITSIREPYAQFKSTFHYYNIAKLAKIPEEVPDTISEYLRNIDKYESYYQSRQAAPQRYCVPDGFSMTKNLMSFNMGMPMGFSAGSEDISENPNAVSDSIERLGSQFDLVMVVEYFDESIILLKRLMCWKRFKDIIYRTLNVGKYKYKTQENLEDIRLYKQRSAVDYQLYNYFNRTLWDKISLEEPSGFWAEVAAFKRTNTKVNEFCNNAKNEDILTIPETRWTREFTVNSGTCKLLGMEIELLNSLKKNYDKLPGDVTQPKPSKYFC